MYYTQEQIDRANQADLVSVPAIAGRTAGTRRTGIPMETARQLDHPGKQMVQAQPEQGRRHPLILSWSFSARALPKPLNC